MNEDRIVFEDDSEPGDAVFVRRGRSAVEFRIGGKSYPIETNKRCKVCCSELRMTIEVGLARGFGYAEIASQLPEGSNITGENVSRHFRNGHFPEDAFRKIVEKRARERGIDPDVEMGSLVTHLSFAKSVLQTGFERLVLDGHKPTIYETMRAAEHIFNVETVLGGSIQAEELRQAFVEFYNIVLDCTTMDQRKAIVQQAQRNPVLARFAAQEEERWQSDALPVGSVPTPE